MKTRKLLKILRVLLIVCDYVARLLKQFFASKKQTDYVTKEEGEENQG